MTGLTWAVAAVVTDDAGRVLLCRGGRRWALPGGRLRRPACPSGAVADEVRRETGRSVEVTDLVGIYHLTDTPCGRPAASGSPRDVLVHVFRARVRTRHDAGPPAGYALAWHRPGALPAEVTPVTRASVADALAGRSGVLRDLRPEPP
ncbi:NUDIX hydrolase [Micromonospora halophytica]|uniref:NUDIX domain-containing protein n=1 Tax=Micromonospora halophytica TaxID=47864 RepID=A0A1C5GU52_9ACTN|nr:NUDIX domain-containing protein [Micromonospora halophytica]SCG37319.1 NUDIX domain-containing protein [Micromonospora halophytica]